MLCGLCNLSFRCGELLGVLSFAIDNLAITLTYLSLCKL
jgi:hypothetical protein